MTKIKIGLADDHEFIRNSITNILNQQPAFEVVLQASNGKVLLEILEHIPCDIILMDIRMPEMDGIEAAAQIRQRFPKVKVAAFSLYDTENNILTMYANGVRSFISKESGTEELLRALKKISESGIYLSGYADEIIQRNLNMVTLAEPATLYTKHESAKHPLSKLSNKELTILYHVANHFSIKEIADKMLLSPNTINNRQAELRKKLNLYGRKALLIFALSNKAELKEILNK